MNKHLKGDPRITEVCTICRDRSIYFENVREEEKTMWFQAIIFLVCPHFGQTNNTFLKGGGFKPLETYHESATGLIIVIYIWTVFRVRVEM